MRFIGNVEKDAQVRAVASGALSTGDTVIVNSDGTVSVVAEVPDGAGTPVVFEAATTGSITSSYDVSNEKVVIAYNDNANSGYGTAIVGTVSGSSISFGSPVVFESASTGFFSSALDSVNNKVVICYRDNGNSNYGTAIVGTVSGTSISFGTASVFESGTIFGTTTSYDANAEKIVVSYRDFGNSNYGTSAVGTVSGTSISFGTPVVFESASIDQYLSSTYDPDSQKVIVTYTDIGNSRYGTAIVGTASGTSISFGTPVVFANNGSTIYFSAVYHSSAQKVVISYMDQGNSNYGTAIVGTVSGTSISFGTPVVFEAAESQWISSAYDSFREKVVISYSDFGDSNHGKAVIATVSGTSISFGSPIVFEAASANRISSSYDVASGKVVISYRDDDNLDYGTSSVFTVGGPNLTSENFLGFAAHTYADTQSAVINSTCTVDRNQSGLTAGQKYYVQTDGSLGTTAADPSVEAGTAISSTEIIVKG